jgi:hypothetical protein
MTKDATRRAATRARMVEDLGASFVDALGI